MKATRKTIPTLIEKRAVFQNTSGTLQAVSHPDSETVKRVLLSKDTESQLNEDEKSRLRIDNDTSGIAYLVISYDTPIAWETEDGHIHKVTQKFTQTTSKHQGMLYLFHQIESHETRQ